MCSSTHAEHAERAEGEAMPKRKDLSKEIELLFELIEDISAVRDDAQQANAELQNVLQEQQQLRGRISELRGTVRWHEQNVGNDVATLGDDDRQTVEVH